MKKIKNKKKSNPIAKKLINSIFKNKVSPNKKKYNRKKNNKY